MAVAMALKTGGEAFAAVGEREEVGLGAGEFGKVILSVGYSGLRRAKFMTYVD
ncbi:hypothetical protein ETAA8_17180 [Anatilimnocola aggregata]|uniref:Uncharacterized protein n=1 Tax=Anatilimnocola aggregata TaxID=2528021 RepID=A0A517Y8S1_9BACT|nr:hypothetical protein ETAA8_17180 [Anatilimnocola aggregata]